MKWISVAKVLIENSICNQMGWNTYFNNQSVPFRQIFLHKLHTNMLCSLALFVRWGNCNSISKLCKTKYQTYINWQKHSNKHIYHSCQPSKPKIRIMKVENSEHKTKNRNKNLFCVSECHTLILLHLLQYKHVKIRFKSPPPHRP